MIFVAVSSDIQTATDIAGRRIAMTIDSVLSTSRSQLMELQSNGMQVRVWLPWLPHRAALLEGAPFRRSVLGGCLLR